MSKKIQHSQNSFIYIYGHHSVVDALLNPKREKIELLGTKEALENIEKTIPTGLKKRIIQKQELDSLSERGLHQGLVLKARPLSPPFLDEITKSTKEKSCLIALDQVTDPHNIGAMLRSATAFEADGILLPEAGSPRESSVMSKISCGGIEKTPLIYVKNLARTLDILKKEGYWIIGLDGKADELFGDSKLPAKVVFIMGAEGTGLRRLTQEMCDYLIKLPISPKMESLNVSNACAIALYEYNRLHSIKF